MAATSLYHWLLFVLGWSIHLLLQAKASVDSKSNGLTSVVQWLRVNWLVVAARIFLAVCAMLVWHEAPQMFGDLSGRVVPVTYGTSGIFGFAVDAFVDKVTFIFGLKVEVPQIVPPTADGRG